MPIRAPQPQAEQPSSPYLPPGPVPLMFEQFQGINTSTSRPGVPDAQMWWCDGFFPIGPRLLRTLPGVGPELWDVSQSSEPAGVQISFYSFANINANPFCVVIMTNGSIYAVNTATGIATKLAAAGTITNPSQLNVGITQWGASFVIIVAAQTNGYFVWDGNVFYAPGDSFGGGNIPSAIGGNAVEVYQSRVWVATGPLITFSSPGSLIDFTTGSGGGQFSSVDSFLRVGYTALRQSNGFLYLVGDSSLNYISGVQTSGSPPVTTFTNQNADPEVGTPWPNSVTTFGRNILFANSFGVHVSYGAAVTKVSEALDGVYQTVDNFGGLIPSAAKAIVFGKKIWMLLLPIVDPFSGQQTSKLLIWTGPQGNQRGGVWFASAQNVELTFIQNQEIQSVITAWGTNGNGIWPLFQSPAGDFTKVVQSRLWDTPVGYNAIKAAARLWALVQVFDFVDLTDVIVDIDSETTSNSYTLQFTSPGMVWENDLGNTMTWTNVLGHAMTWQSTSGNISVAVPVAVAQVGALTGVTFRTRSADIALISLMLQDEVVGART